MDIKAYGGRVRRRVMAATTLFFGGSLMLVVDFTTRFPTEAKGEFAGIWLFAMALGGWFYYRSQELPRAEVMAAAEARGGLVTEGELATALEVGPEVIHRTLVYLQSLGIACARWEDLRRNVWEFPDYLKLPIGEAVELAKAAGGRVTMGDLLAKGHSVDVARETLSAMKEKGLGREEGEGDGRGVVVGNAREKS